MGSRGASGSCSRSRQSFPCSRRSRCGYATAYEAYALGGGFHLLRSDFGTSFEGVNPYACPCPCSSTGTRVRSPSSTTFRLVAATAPCPIGSRLPCVA